MPAGPVYKYDFSLALPLIYDLVEATRSRLAHLPATVVSYGHLGETWVWCTKKNKNKKKTLTPKP